MANVITIVAPVFNEEQNIPLFLKAVESATKNVDYNFEVIFVDDGSSDGSVDVIHKLTTNDKKFTIKLVQFSRNFGKEVAITAGLHAAKGEAAILIDTDLQHPADKIPEFIAKWEKGAEVVIGVRKLNASGSTVKRTGSEAFYKIMGWMSDTVIVPHSTDFRLVDRQVIDEFKKLPEHNRITRGLIDWLGFRRDFVQFQAKNRRFGHATYSTKKLMKLALDSFTSHSLFPLRIAGYIGVILTVVFGALGIGLYIENYVMHDPASLNVSGTAMLAILMLFSIGVVLACLGLVAMYVAHIHEEVMRRPLYVIRKTRNTPK